MTRRTKIDACRVCGCTYERACEGGCWWTPVEKGSPLLCSACAGTEADMVEAIGRGVNLLSGPGLPHRNIDKAVAIGRAALRRKKARAAGGLL